MKVLRRFKRKWMIVAIILLSQSIFSMEKSNSTTPKIQVILGKVENKLKKPLTINDWSGQKDNKPRATFQLDGSPIQMFNKEIIFVPLSNNNEYIGIGFANKPAQHFGLVLQVMNVKSRNIIKIGLERVSKDNAANSRLFYKEFPIAESGPLRFIIDLIIDGANFENSKLIIREFPSLKELSIKACAEQFKAGKLTKEKIKFLPQEMQDALDKYLDQNK